MSEPIEIRDEMLKRRFPKFPQRRFFRFADVETARQFVERVVPFKLKLDPSEWIIRPTRSGLVYTLDGNLVGWLRDSRGVRIMVRWNESVGSMRAMNWENIWIDLNGAAVQWPPSQRLMILKPTATKERRGLLMEKRIQGMFLDPDFRL